MILSIQHNSHSVEKRFLEIETLCEFSLRYVDVSARVSLRFETITEQLTYDSVVRDLFDAVLRAQRLSEKTWQVTLCQVSSDFETAA